MVLKIAEDVPGSDPLGLGLSVIVAGHLVDSSPLSTIGALLRRCAAGEGGGPPPLARAHADVGPGDGGCWGAVVLGVVWGVVNRLRRSVRTGPRGR